MLALVRICGAKERHTQQGEEESREKKEKEQNVQRGLSTPATLRVTVWLVASTRSRVWGGLACGDSVSYGMAQGSIAYPTGAESYACHEPNELKLPDGFSLRSCTTKG
jgi:hypothetical protein